MSDNSNFDSQYKGRLNPRCTFHCFVCGEYYSNRMEDEPKNGDFSTTLIVGEDGEGSDCVHYNNIEINKEIYETHIQILKDSGYLEEDWTENN